jgi:hypothetical protein
MSLTVTALIVGVLVVTVLSVLVSGIFNKSPQLHVVSELRYRHLKWRLNRMRRQCDSYSGERAEDVDRRVHK